MAIVSGFQSGGGEAKQITPPLITGDSFIYDGTSQGPTITGFDNNTMVLTGTTSAINEGIYTFTIALKNHTNMIWSDTGYNAPRIYQWEIVVPIYGAEWDGSSSPAWSRTDDAVNFTDPNPYYSGMSGTASSPFDNCHPWSEIKIVEDSDLGTLVEIPKFWYKWTVGGSSMKLQISSQPFDGALVSPAHADRGDGEGERDFVYVGRYHCDSAYKSTTGVKPKGSITRPTARTSIKALKTGAYQFDFAMFWTIRMLYLVEFANWDSQACIGYGCGNGSSTENMGYTDSMPYHTGTTQSSRTTYGLGTQYRYIEGLWDNVLDWCDGIYFNSTSIYAINNPNNFSDSSNGTKIGTRPTSSAEIKSWTIPNVSGLEWALYPNEVTSNSNYDTYVCDYCSYDPGGWGPGVALDVGGYYSRKRDSGLFWLYGSASASTSGGNIGTRLQYLPPNS